MKHKLLLTGITAFVCLFAATPPAEAGIGACGDIHVEGNASCQVEVEGACTAQCTPVSFQAACAAELRASCDAQCTELPKVECTGSCDIGSCKARCEVDPGNFSCEGECNAEGEAQCAAECEAANNRGECEASCKATFSAKCEGSCSGTPPQADCEARCEASCEGRCEAEANLGCQVECQGEGFAECKAELQGGCEVACSKPEGALFCDGQFVDHGGNLQSCIDAIEARLNIEVDVSSRGSATGDCSGSRCSGSAEGEASASCAYAPMPLGGSGALGWLCASAGLLVARRRRSAP